MRDNILEIELRWLDCLIEREVLRLRGRYELSLDELRGLYISDAQVDELIRDRIGGDNRRNPAAELSARAQELAPQYRVGSPIDELGRRTGLVPPELDLVLLAAAPEIDLRYETLFAYLNNDVTKKFLTVDLALRLLDQARTSEAPGTGGHRALLSPTAALRATGVLKAVDPGHRQSSLSRGFVIDPLVAQFLTCQPLWHADWPHGTKWLQPAAGAATLVNFCEEERRCLEKSAQLPVTVIAGDDPCERQRYLVAWAAIHDRPILLVNLSALDGTSPHVDIFTLASRLGDAALAVTDDLPPRGIGAPATGATAFSRLLAARTPLLFLTAHLPQWMSELNDRPFTRIDVSLPDVAGRARLWQEAIPIPTECAIGLAQRFAIGPGQIAAAARSVATHIVPGEALHPTRLSHLLGHQAAQRCDRVLARLATRLSRPHGWQHLILPETTLQQLRDVVIAINQRERVYRTWGMLQRTARSSGIMIMFTGSSGTGKTMAASVIANEVGLDLYRIDLASVVSKYIGETEQNLERIFTAARASSAMLLFDEADALLGKRSEIKDAHDRYANLEVAYLLQKMEEHDGIVILASNLAKNLDPAFARRLHYSIEFSRPNSRQREILWRGMFPSAVPLATDIDFQFLAEKFETTGGEIQAIALDAAFLAAAENSSVGMTQLMRAMTRRQTKQGNPGGMARFNEHHHGPRAANGAADPVMQ